MIEYPHPTVFDKELSNKKLTYIAKLMLQVFDTSLRDIKDKYDDRYTFSTNFFKRTVNCFTHEFQSEDCPFKIEILNDSNKFIFQLGQTSCRFFEEKDYLHPTKKGAFIRDIQPQRSLFDEDIGLPIFSNFYLMTHLDEDNNRMPTVVFVSYDTNKNIVSFWEYNSSSFTPSIQSDDLYTPDSNNQKRTRNLSSKHKKANKSNDD